MTRPIRLTTGDIQHIRKTADQGRGLLRFEAYCDQSSCPAREIRVDVKDYDKNLITHLEADGLRCPICREELKVYAVATKEDAAAADNRVARSLVAQQMYVRDHQGGASSLVTMPTTVQCDERLPPTPKGWWK